MLDFGFSEILLTSAIALVVLGPEQLPKVARQVGNWMGRARVMARQLTEQLDREITAEELLRSAAETGRAFHSDWGGLAASGGGRIRLTATHRPCRARRTPRRCRGGARADGDARAASAASASAFSDALRDTAEPAPSYPSAARSRPRREAAGPSETSRRNAGTGNRTETDCEQQQAAK